MPGAYSFDREMQYRRVMIRLLKLVTDTDDITGDMVINMESLFDGVYGKLRMSRQNIMLLMDILTFFKDSGGDIPRYTEDQDDPFRATLRQGIPGFPED
jgi:hypothetical protein